MQWAPGLHGSLRSEDSTTSLAICSDLEDQLHDNALKTFAEWHLSPANYSVAINYHMVLKPKIITAIKVKSVLSI